MCGICGIVNWKPEPVKKDTIAAMQAAMHHRGPDADGDVFLNTNNACLGFGFKRLSILDLANGQQPMRWGPYTLVFNGEVYNFKELRQKFFNGPSDFKTQSDTEVVLRLLAKLGKDALQQFNGMFALALWNQDTQELLLARDRLGIKPLYYFYQNQTCAFASEIKSLYASGLFSLQANSEQIFNYFSYRFTPSPHSLWHNVFKLQPGQWISWDASGQKQGYYWSIAQTDTFNDYKKPVEQLDQLLNQSVDLQLISDVPVGSFLSGGIDSSLITALAARKTKDALHTFSVAFEDASGQDESIWAHQVARQYNTRHHHVLLRAQDLNAMESVLQKMTEPAADPTVLPTALLSDYARKYVKVVLTGEGADELFAGYNRYKAVYYQQKLMSLPPALRGAAAAFLKLFYNKLVLPLGSIGRENWFNLHADFPKQQVLDLLRQAPLLNADVVAKAADLNTILKWESATVLPERLLMKVDMASMGSSLEARPPFLDHHLVQWALNLNADYKIKHFKGKYILRQVAQNYLPKSICWRRKHGFVVPLEFWWKSPSSKIKPLLLDYANSDILGVWNSQKVADLCREAKHNPSGKTIAQLWPIAIFNLHARSLLQ